MLYDIRIRRDFYISDQDGTRRAEPFASHQVDFQMDCATSVQAALLTGKLLGKDAPGTETEIESITPTSREDIAALAIIEAADRILSRDDEAASSSHAAKRAEELSI